MPVRSHIVLFALLLVSCVALSPLASRAATTDEIRDQIAAINKERAKLDAEIAGYEKQLQAISGQKQTLQSAIQTLDVSRSKTATQIKDIQAKIKAATLKLDQLAIDIQEKEASISLDQTAVAASLRAISDADDMSLIERLVASDDFAEAWTQIDELSSLTSALQEHADALAEVKAALRDQHEAVAGTKNELASSNKTLESQKNELDLNRQGKQQLLSRTQAQEAEYQAIVTQKRAQQKAFESQLFTYEAQLKAALDPKSFASAHTGVLAYPIDNPYVTQYFGRTVDAKRLYVSGTHGGVDFRASIGTPIKAALSGTVTDTEATITRSGCQYGKWVLIKHANGLSTLYGHLSSVSVRPGDSVDIGEVIGYAGDTGYATGPHLHFGVYATSGIKITDASALGSTYCAGIKTVAANPDAYLDPMSYL